MKKRVGIVLAVMMALGALGGFAAGPARAQGTDSAPSDTSAQVRDRQLRDLSKDIRQRDQRLQKLEREIGALKRKKGKADDGGKDARYNARINRLRDERNRLNRANQLDSLQRNRLRGQR